LEPKALPAVPNRLPLEAPLEAGAPKENVFDMMRNVCRGVGIIRAALVTVRRDGKKSSCGGYLGKIKMRETYCARRK
jgi:hypothetical protein